MLSFFFSPCFDLSLKHLAFEKTLNQDPWKGHSSFFTTDPESEMKFFDFQFDPEIVHSSQTPLTETIKQETNVLAKTHFISEIICVFQIGTKFSAEFSGMTTKSNANANNEFKCENCSFISHYDYFGSKPPFSKKMV